MSANSRSVYRDTVLSRRDGDGVLIPAAGVQVRFYVPDDPGMTPLPVPLYAGPDDGTPLNMPYVTGMQGEIEVWVDGIDGLRARQIVFVHGVAASDETVDFEPPPGSMATDADVADAIAAHQVDPNAHDQYLTPAEADLAYVNVDGDRMTGDLELKYEANPSLLIRGTTAGGEIQFADNAAWISTWHLPVRHLLISPNLFVDAGIWAANKKVAVSATAGNALTWNSDGFYTAGGITQAAADLRYVNTNGDSMTGTLHVTADQSTFHSATSAGVALVAQPVDDVASGNPLLGVVNAPQTQWMWFVRKDGSTLQQGQAEFYGQSHFFHTLYVRGDPARIMSLEAPLRLNTAVGDLIFERGGGQVGSFRSADNFFTTYAGAVFGGDVLPNGAYTLELGSAAAPWYRTNTQWVSSPASLYLDAGGGGAVLPSADNSLWFGAPTQRWSNVFSYVFTGGGAMTAAAGALRLPNGATGNIQWRNATNTGDLTLGTDASNNLLWNGNPFVTQAVTDPLYVNVGGDSMTGPLNLTGTSGTYKAIYGQTLASNRWGLFLGDGTNETGANAGSDLRIVRFADNGTVIDNTLVISRATNAVGFGGNLSAQALTTSGAGASVNFNDRDGSGAWVVYNQSDILRFFQGGDKMWIDPDGTLLTKSGTIPVKLSPDAGNVLEWRSNGIWATGVAGSGITTGEADLRYVNLTGDSMTGSLVVNADNSAFRAATSNGGGALRLIPSDDANPSAILFGVLNTGQSEWIYQLHKNGYQIGRGGIMTGDWTVAGNLVGQALYLNGAAGSTETYGPIWQRSNQWRWYAAVWEVETGSNSGSNWGLTWMHDGGAYGGVALKFIRATQQALFSGDVAVNTALAANGTLQINGPRGIIHFNQSGGGEAIITSNAGIPLKIRSGSGGAADLYLASGSTYVNPEGHLSNSLGSPSMRWNMVYAGGAEFTAPPTISSQSLDDRYVNTSAAGDTMAGPLTATGVKVTTDMFALNVDESNGQGKFLAFPHALNDHGWALGTWWGQDALALFRLVGEGGWDTHVRFVHDSGSTYFYSTFQNAAIITNNHVVIDGPAASPRHVIFSTAGLARWIEGSDIAAETGSNAGSNFRISRYSDAGALLGDALTISRATGAATFGAAVSATDFMATAATGNVHLRNSAGQLRLRGASDIVLDAAVGNVVPPASNTKDFGHAFNQWRAGYFANLQVTGDGSTSGFYAAAGAVRLRNGATGNLAWRNASNTADVTFGVNTGNQFALVGSAGLIMPSPLIVADPAGVSLVLDSLAGTARSVRWRTGGVDRWIAQVEPNAETGSNVGSDWFLYRYSDAGAYLGTALGVNRATGAATFGGDVNVNGTYARFNYADWRPQSGTTTWRTASDSNLWRVGIADVSWIMGVGPGGIAVTGQVDATSTITSAGKPVAVSPDASNALEWRANGFYSGGGAGGAYLPLTGGTLTGPLTINASGWMVAPSYYVDGAVGTNRDIYYTTATAARWRIGAGNGAETGSNAGSDFRIIRYSDAAAALGDALTITRSSGHATFEAGATFAAAVSAGAFTATQYVLAPNLYADAGAGTSRGLNYRTNGSLRWQLFATSDAETGFNAGTNLYLLSYTDAGGYLRTNLSFDRPSGAATFGAGVTISTGHLNVMSGDLLMPNATARVVVGDAANDASAKIDLFSIGLYGAAEANARATLGQTTLGFGPGTGVTDTRLARVAATTWGVTGSMRPVVTNVYDLGTTALRWKKLWATDAEFTGGLLWAGAQGLLDVSGSNPRVNATGVTNLELYGNGAYVHPSVDAVINLGSSAKRWFTMYASVGAINTSVYEAKEEFSPLDPAACAAAVLETDWVSFAFKPPAPAWEGEGAPAPRDGETAADRKAALGAHARMLVETAPARHQKGYVLQSPVHNTHDLFGLADRKSASPSSDLAVVACALQSALQRIAQLEAQIGAA